MWLVGSVKRFLLYCLIKLHALCIPTFTILTRSSWDSRSTSIWKSAYNLVYCQCLLTRVSDPDSVCIRINLRIQIRKKMRIRIRAKKVRKGMNKSLFCRVGDMQCKQFHFFSSDSKHPLLRIIWNVKKTKKKSFFPFTPSPLPLIPPGSGSAWKILPGSGSAKKNTDPKPWKKLNLMAEN